MCRDTCRITLLSGIVLGAALLLPSTGQNVCAQDGGTEEVEPFCDDPNYPLYDGSGIEAISDAGIDLAIPQEESGAEDVDYDYSWIHWWGKNSVHLYSLQGRDTKSMKVGLYHSTGAITFNPTLYHPSQPNGPNVYPVFDALSVESSLNRETGQVTGRFRSQFFVFNQVWHPIDEDLLQKGCATTSSFTILEETDGAFSASQYGVGAGTVSRAISFHESGVFGTPDPTTRKVLGTMFFRMKVESHVVQKAWTPLWTAFVSAESEVMQETSAATYSNPPLVRMEAWRDSKCFAHDTVVFVPHLLPVPITTQPVWRDDWILGVRIGAWDF